MAIGTNTDPYQPIEREQRLTRQALEILLRYRHPVHLITKSSLILRDLDLLQELADSRDEKIKLIGRCSLDGFLWEQMTRCYGYKSDEPGIRDFAIELFKSCYAMGTDGHVKLTGDALVFLKRWSFEGRGFHQHIELCGRESLGSGIVLRGDFVVGVSVCGSAEGHRGGHGQFVRR